MSALSTAVVVTVELTVELADDEPDVDTVELPLLVTVLLSDAL